MNNILIKILIRWQQETQGQDLVEYALVAGFVAVAGGALFPTTVMPNVSTIFSRIASSLAAASPSGS